MNLLPALTAARSGHAIAFGEQMVSYGQLASAADHLAGQLHEARRVLIHAESRAETIVATVAALTVGAAIIPCSPKLGPRELGHVIEDCQPDVVLAGEGADLSPELHALPIVTVAEPGAERELVGLAVAADPEAPAFIIYTSGTTGPPKGAVISHRAVAANLDALAAVWDWTAADVVTHGLPLSHVHGLILGTLGPLRFGGGLRHLRPFTAESLVAALQRDATVVFAVPTMYHRLAEAATDDPAVADSLAQARLLVSGSAALPLRDHEQLYRLTGRRVLERYGMTETLINCAERADTTSQPGSVGPPLPGVALRIIDDMGQAVPPDDSDTIGEIEVQGPNLLDAYLNRPQDTADALRDGWFATGDMASWTLDGAVRIVGRKTTDLIKTGGYRVGAGEVEAALLEHEGVAESAVLGLSDPDLGERIVAWVAMRPGASAEPSELSDHVAALLAPHKRPREIRFCDALPRNEMGKVLKTPLREMDATG